MCCEVALIYQVTMKIFPEACILNLFVSCILLHFGDGTYASSYNYSITTECLKDPPEALYGGGILVNPEFNHNIEGWILYGEGKIEERKSNEGNRFLVAHSRKDSLAGFSQKVQVEEGKIYSFSASVQISEGSEVVAVVFKFPSGEGVPGGYVIAEHGCWTLLKGGIVANFTSPVDILFESKNTSVDIWLDNVSLQPFTKEEWKAHQDKSINEVRKRKVRIQVSQGKLALRSANVSIKQIKSGFPFGCAMNHNILTNSDYQNWFTSRFKFTTFTNEMKWYSTEKIRGHENYTTADSMVKFAIQNAISIRGHNVFWDDPRMQPSWLNNSLPGEEILIEAAKRISSVIPRYRGQLIAWDVVNENLHFRFFEDKVSENASGAFYYAAQQLDPDTIMFMNEYATIEYSLDEKASPVHYKKKFQEILSYPGNANLSAGIGLQGHFGTGQPNLAYMRSALDILGAMGFPVWLTEVDVAKHQNQSQYLEEVLREGFSHPAVQGIIMFVGPETAGFNVTTLADKNFQNTPSGDVVDKLIAEWSGNLETTTNDQGFIDVPLFHGDYEVTAEDPNNKSPSTLSLTVRKDEPQEIVHVQINNI